MSVEVVRPEELSDRINYGKQCVGSEELEAVARVLKSPFLTQGPEVEKFESDLASYTGANYACATTNGTTALHLLYLALGLGSGDLLVTTSITFAATANAGKYCGADVKFVDIDLNTFLLDLDKLEKILISDGPRIKIVTVVSLTGFPVPVDYWERLNQLKAKYDFYIVEDSCHSLGARRLSCDSSAVEMVGDCRYTDGNVFSFHPVKNITCGEGGMITTNSKTVDERCRLLRSHALEKNSNPLLPEINHVGFNYRLTDIQAAIGGAQLKKIDAFIGLRNSIADIYNKELSPKIVRPLLPKGATHALHVYVIRSDRRDEIFWALKEHNIHCMLHYKPLYRFKVFQSDIPFSEFENAETYFETALSLPIYPTLLERDVLRVCKIINEVVGG